MSVPLQVSNNNLNQPIPTDHGDSTQSQKEQIKTYIIKYGQNGLFEKVRANYNGDNVNKARLLANIKFGNIDFLSEKDIEFVHGIVAGMESEETPIQSTSDRFHANYQNNNDDNKIDDDTHAEQAMDEFVSSPENGSSDQQEVNSNVLNVPNEEEKINHFDKLSYNDLNHISQFCSPMDILHLGLTTKSNNALVFPDEKCENSSFQNRAFQITLIPHKYSFDQKCQHLKDNQWDEKTSLMYSSDPNVAIRVACVLEGDISKSSLQFLLENEKNAVVKLIIKHRLDIIDSIGVNENNSLIRRKDNSLKKLDDKFLKDLVRETVNRNDFSAKHALLYTLILSLDMSKPDNISFVLRKIDEAGIREDRARFMIMSDPTLPDDIRKIFYSEGLEKRLIEDPKTPVFMLQLMASTGREVIQLEMARSAHMPNSVQLLLANSQFSSVVAAMAENPRTKDAVIEKLIKNLPQSARWLRYLAYANTNLSLSAQRILAECNDSNVRRALAKNKNLDKHIAEMLTSDPSPQVHAAVAGNPNMTIKGFDRLLNKSDPEINLRLASNPNVPSIFLYKMAQNENSSDKLKIAIAKNPKVEANTLDLLAKKPNEKLALAIISNSNASPDTRLKLFKTLDQKYYGRFAKAKNTTSEILDHIYKNNNHFDGQIAMHPNASAKCLHKLARESNNMERTKKLHITECIIENPNSDSSTLSYLSGRVRTGYLTERAMRLLASRKDAPPKALRNVSQHDRIEIKALLLKNPSTPSDVVNKLAQSINEEISQPAKNHPNYTGK